MMDYVGRPKQTAFVRNTMEPIIGEVISKKNEHKTPPSKWNSEKPKMFVDIKKGSQYNGLAQEAQ